MKVIIIAAGGASRLAKYTKKFPKGLLDINGKSIFERQISLFRKNGIDDILIITGPEKNFGTSEVTYVNDSEFQKHDVLGSLMAARKYLTEDIITCYSDILFEEKILQQIMHSLKDISIGIDLDWEKNYEGRTEHPKSEADNVVIKNNKIMKIKKNITNVKKGESLGEFIGLMKLSKKGCKIFVNTYERLEKTHNGKFQNAPSLQKAYLTDMLQELIDSKIQVSPVLISGTWYEIDTPQDLENARKIFH